jgi:hypothetical protein
MIISVEYSLAQERQTFLGGSDLAISDSVNWTPQQLPPDLLTTGLALIF